VPAPAADFHPVDPREALERCIAAATPRTFVRRFDDEARAAADRLRRPPPRRRATTHRRPPPMPLP
jgi:hypothetical protein